MRKRLISIFAALILCISALSACTRGESSVTPEETTEALDPTTPKPTETDPPESSPSETEPSESTPQETEPIDPDTLMFTPENYPKVDGSTSTKPLAKSLQEEFTGEENVEIKHSKSHQSYLNLVDGLCDMILAVEPSPDEYAYAKEKGVTMKVEKVTNEGFVFFVNKRNPVESLTIEQIRGIYSGKIRNWKEVGGLDAEIVAFQRPVNSGSQTGMESLVMKDLPMMEPVTGTVADTMNEIVDVISAFDSGENAIGYSYYYYANTMYLGENVKLIAVEGVKPNNTTLREGDYPLLTAYYAITREGDVSKETLALIQGILSERGQRAVQRAGYVPITDVGEYDPEHPEASEERTVSLSDTYSIDPVCLEIRTDSIDGNEYHYGTLKGLSDPVLTEKINSILKEDAEKLAKRGLSEGGKNAKINYDSIQVESSFGNVLSVSYWISFIRGREWGFRLRGGTNIRLDTGDRLTLHDLFKTDTRGKDIFNADFYSELVFKTADTKPVPGHYAPSVKDYNDAEDRQFSLIQDYDSGKEFNFFFTPRCVVILDELENDVPSGANELNLWFTHCMEEVTVYQKYLDVSVPYDGQYQTIEGIPALTDRGDPYRGTFERTADYYLDAGLYSEMEGEIPERYRDDILKYYQELEDELRSELKEKAAGGEYSFYNLTAEATVPVWLQDKDYEFNGKKAAYALNARWYRFGWNSREELNERIERMLTWIRNPHWDGTGGRNNYLLECLDFEKGEYSKSFSKVWYFDAEGKLIGIAE